MHRIYKRLLHQLYKLIQLLPIVRQLLPQQEPGMATIKETIARIESHERECEIRYRSIEEKLKEGSDKFKRLEMMLWGIYPFIVGVFLAGKFL